MDRAQEPSTCAWLMFKGGWVLGYNLGPGPAVVFEISPQVPLSVQYANTPCFQIPTVGPTLP
jgi:hypothetical protein